ncbi:MAG: hypothetical protein K2L64_03105, partial [Ureaplasma sp.]|nr:hypothetical protein [Ureaplasma sp.]
MTKSKKIILSLSIATPIVIGSTILVTSCSTTYPFVAPQPINLNNDVLDKINNKLVETNSKLNSMTNFSDVFKIQNELLDFFKTNSDFKFDKNLDNVKINIKPSYLNNQLKYDFKYEIEFKSGLDINFEENNNFEFKDNKLLSKEQSLNNTTLNSE